MMMFPADVALATARGRRRASTSARKRTLTEDATAAAAPAFLSAASRSFSGRRSAPGLSDDARGPTEASALPPAIALLEQVSMSFSVTRHHQSDVRYVMTVHHGALRVGWRHARSFDEYRKLQQRLLKVLSHGHFCDADCPWLYTFLKSYFPKKHLFSFGASARAVEARRETLARFFSTLQTCLLNRANHVCAVMTTAFTAELVAFIYGDALQQHGLGDVQTLLSGAEPALASVATRGSPQSARGSLSFKSMRKSSSLNLDAGSFLSLGDDEFVDDADDCCALCESSLSGEAFASSQSLSLTVSSSEDEPPELSASLPTTLTGLSALSRANSTRSAGGRSARRYYTTTLGCGHQFHDECIVPKLNESLACPTCGHLETSN